MQQPTRGIRIYVDNDLMGSIPNLGSYGRFLEAHSITEADASLSCEDLLHHKTIEIKNAQANMIMAGFTCDVLGEDHTYPAEVIDQMNLNICVTRAILRPNENITYPNLRVSDGVWMRRDHTADQIKDVGVAMVDFGLLLRDNAYAKVGQLHALAADGNYEAMLAIKWDLT